MNFQALDLKGKNFLKLLNNDLNLLEPSTIKSRPWLQYFGHSNSLCTKLLVIFFNFSYLTAKLSLSRIVLLYQITSI